MIELSIFAVFCFYKFLCSNKINHKIRYKNHRSFIIGGI